MKAITAIRGWWLWLIAAIFYALDYFQHTAPSVLIKPIADSAHISFTSVGNIMSLYFPIYAISQIPAGYLLDKFGVRAVLTTACLIVSVGLALMSFPLESALVIGRMFIAIGSAFAFLGALKTASTVLSQKVFPIAVGLTNTIGVLGGILGQPFLNYLIEQFNWVHATHIITFFGLGLAVFILVFLRIPKPGVMLEKPKFTVDIFKDQRLWFLAIYAGIMVGTVVNAFSELYDVTFLQGVFAVNAQKAANISSMIFIGIAIGGPLHGMIARLFKQTKTWMLIGCIATIVSFALIIVSAMIRVNANLLFILYFFTGFFVSSMLLSFSVARCCYEKHVHATIFALVNMVIGLCGFIFQFGLGLLLKWLMDVLGTHHAQQIYSESFLFLLVPLLFSLWFCIKIKRPAASDRV